MYCWKSCHQAAHDGVSWAYEPEGRHAILQQQLVRQRIQQIAAVRHKPLVPLCEMIRSLVIANFKLSL